MHSLENVDTEVDPEFLYDINTEVRPEIDQRLQTHSLLALLKPFKLNTHSLIKPFDIEPT